MKVINLQKFSMTTFNLVVALCLSVLIFGIHPPVAAQERIVSSELNDILYAVEDKCDEFIQAFHDKRFYDIIAMLNGTVKLRFEKFMQLYQEDHATYKSDIPEVWKLLGSKPGDKAGQYVGYANIDFPNGNSSIMEMVWQKDNSELLIVHLENISKSDIKDVSLHISTVEREVLNRYLGELHRALQNFDSGAFLPLLSEEVGDELIEALVDEEKTAEAKDIFLGTLISIDNIRIGKSRNEAYVMVTVEHKDGADFKVEWHLKRQGNRWILFGMDNKLLSR